MSEKLTAASGDSREFSGAALVIYPYLIRNNPADPDARLEEAVSLAHAIRLHVVEKMLVPQKVIKPSTYLSHGKCEEIKALVEEHQITVVVVDASISPVQQRNLETLWETKVIDRTGLILEIFGERAQTAEGRLQVELAALTYQRSRLVRSWTHLERQRGGFGFMGGPGESQIEMDRRLIDERVVKIKRELESVKRTRGLHRQARKRVPYPIVALVGYTNAGKSTLFNRLTQSQVMAKDMLFATLDPTLRKMKLPSGREVILSDTVGFISELPTLLVAAFRATLEEVLEADLVVHVRDMAHPLTESQKKDVEDVLQALESMAIDEGRFLEVLNKRDLLSSEEALYWEKVCERQEMSALISAQTGEGVSELLAKIDDFFARQMVIVDLLVPYGEGALLAWIHAHGEVLEMTDGDAGHQIRVRLSESLAAKLKGLTG